MNCATKKLFATAVLALVLAATAAAQAQDQGGTQAAPGGTQPAPTTQPAAGGDQGQPLPTDWYVGKPIKDFTFTGLVTVKESELKPIVSPYIGQAFRVDPLLWDIEGKLYALDYFETIVPNALPSDAARSGVII
ncbi:MAG TPA: hypothetical protein VMM82_14840, partial [Spirochaetia bacterium]|nr:hypothetical protein [Spirochaetia bacterium]